MRKFNRFFLRDGWYRNTNLITYWDEMSKVNKYAFTRKSNRVDDKFNPTL